MDNLFFIDEVLCIISIFGLGLFSVVLPKLEIAKYFYLLFGITMIPVGIEFVLDGVEWYAYIWAFVFSVVGIIMGILIPGPGKNISKKDREQLNKQFGQASRDSAKRKLLRDFFRK